MGRRASQCKGAANTRGTGLPQRAFHPGGRKAASTFCMCTQDNTNVRAYLPEVEAFLAEARRRGWALNTFSERDCALADMIAILCYVERAGIQRARNLFAGFVHVYPEHGGHLPEADRALKSWERLDTGGEGGPICEEAWGAVIVAFVRGGDDEGGLVSGLSFDCLLRG